METKLFKLLSKQSDYALSCLAYKLAVKAYMDGHHSDSEQKNEETERYLRVVMSYKTGREWILLLLGEKKLEEFAPKCPHCGKTLSLAVLRDYTYSCNEDEEDFYRMEVEDY